jgi:chlorobactene glucosyltransferase
MIENWKRTIPLSLLVPPLAYHAHRMYQALPELPPAQIEHGLPMLSIIVPARNEAHNLPHLLPSLRNIAYPGEVEIIVVDDNSADDTAVVAAQHGARVISLSHLPPGWKGKPHALCQGAQVARGEWLLFTDADTIHNPDGPAQAVAYAEREQLDGLSLFLTQEYRSLADRLSLTAAFTGLFVAWRPNASHLNGQFILLRRQVYQASGGFSMVRDAVLEDLAMGRHLRQRHYRVPMMRGETAARVRMYQSKQQMWHGLNRLGSQSLPFAGLRALGTIFFVTIAMNPLLVLLGILTGHVRWRWLWLTWGAVFLGFIPWARRYGAFWHAALAPFGALFVQLASFWGLVRRLFRRGIYWKGRIV